MPGICTNTRFPSNPSIRVPFLLMFILYNEIPKIKKEKGTTLEPRIG